MVSKYNKIEVYQECTSFFIFVQDVLRLLTVYSIIIYWCPIKLFWSYLC